MGSWNQAAQGAAGGAMAGSFFGPYGAAIGAGVGGIAGYFGGEGAGKYEADLQKLADRYSQRTAPQAGAASMAGNSAFRANQAGLISQLEAMARGQGPSAAQVQMREAMDRAAGAQGSALAGAGGRGVNAGAAFRNASNNTAAIQAQGARDTSMLRAQEQFNSIGMLGQAVAQGRAADENTSQFNAGQNNAMAQANLEAQLRTLNLNDASQLAALGMAMGTAGPGLGTQLMAGGAQAMPFAMQYQQQQRQMGFDQQQADRQYGLQQQYMNYRTGQGQRTPMQAPMAPAQSSNPYQVYAQNMAANLGQPMAPPTSLPSQGGVPQFNPFFFNF